MTGQSIKENLLKWPYVATLPLLAAGFGMSCFFTGTDTYWFAPPLVCLFLMAFFVFAPGFKAGWQVPRSATAILILLFGLYTVASTFWSQVPYISILFAFVLTSLPFVFFTLVCMKEPVLATRLHAAALCLVICGFALWAMVQFFFMYDKYGPRIHHPMLSPNNLAALFMIGLFMATTLFMRARRRWALAGSYTLVALLVLAFLMTQSRGGLFSAIGGMAIFMVAVRRYPGFHWGKVAGILLALGASILIVNIGSAGWLSHNFGALTSAVHLNSMTDRLSLYESSLHILRDHFWGGIGLGTFYFTYPAYRSTTDYSDGFFVHMDPLQYGVEMGILAPVLFYGILVAVLWRTVRAFIRLPRESTARVEIMAAFCAMLAVTVHTHIDFHLYILVSLIAMAVPLAWWYALTEEALGDTRLFIPAPRLPAWIMQGAFALVLLALVSWPVRAAITTVTMPPAQKAVDEGRLADAQRMIDSISRYSPGNNYRLYQLQGRLAAQTLTMQGRTMPIEDARKVLEQGLAAYGRAIESNTDFTGPYNDRAKLYFLAHGWLQPDGYALAEKDLSCAVENNPLDWDARTGLAMLYQVQGYFSRAARVLERGRQWPLPRGPAGVNLMVMEAQMHQKMGDTATYNALIQQAGEFAVRNGLIPAPSATTPAASE